MPIPRSTPPAFLHASQLKLRGDASAAAIDKANQEALDAALAASEAEDVMDGLTAFQKLALATGDPELIEEANDAALATGLAASEDSSNDVPKSARKIVPADELRAQHGLVDRLKAWLSNHGFAIKRNNGDRNNCLIISMLQHATGNYDSNHEADAKKYKALLVGWSDGTEQHGSPLFSDTELTEKLIDRINRDHFGAAQERYLRFKIVSPDHEGKPAVREIGKGQRVAGIIDGAGHYEAYVRK